MAGAQEARLTKYSPHGTRTTGSTRLNELGHRPDAIEAQLAGAEQCSAHNHATYSDERRAMMQDWAVRLDEESVLRVIQSTNLVATHDLKSRSPKWREMLPVKSVACSGIRIAEMYPPCSVGLLSETLET